MDGKSPGAKMASSSSPARQLHDDQQLRAQQMAPAQIQTQTQSQIHNHDPDPQLLLLLHRSPPRTPRRQRAPSSPSEQPAAAAAAAAAPAAPAPAPAVSFSPVSDSGFTRHRGSPSANPDLVAASVDSSPRQPASTDRGFDSVTPGIQPSTYKQPRTPLLHRQSQQQQQLHDGRLRGHTALKKSSGYFSAADVPTRSEQRRTSFGPVLSGKVAAAGGGDDDGNENETSSPRRHPAGRQDNRRTALAMGRRESLSEIRAANPDLSLSGNIISATFNIPHAFTYRKGGQWVRYFCVWWL